MSQSDQLGLSGVVVLMPNPTDQCVALVDVPIQSAIVVGVVVVYGFQIRFAKIETERPLDPLKLEEKTAAAVSCSSSCC